MYHINATVNTHDMEREHHWQQDTPDIDLNTLFDDDVSSIVLVIAKSGQQQ